MLFVKLARIIAWVALVSGVMRISMGLIVAIAFDGDPAAVARYLGSVVHTGEAINDGIVYVLVGVAFGVIAHIGQQASHKMPATDFTEGER